MKRFQSKKKGKRGKNKSNGLRRGVFSAICHVVGRNEPFKLAQTTSGVGCISNQNTGPSVTAVTNTLVTPFTIGSRAALLAAEFGQWRVNSIVCQYEPDCTMSGVVNTQAGPSTTPSYGSRPFAMGWSKDPDIAPSTHSQIMEIGGVSCNTSRRSRIVFPRSGWLWTSTTTSYSLANGIDNRTCSNGMFNAAFVDASTTAAATYGRFVWTYNVSFRYPQNSSVVGAAPLEKCIIHSIESKVSDGLDPSGASDSPFLSVDGEEVKESQTVCVKKTNETAGIFGPDPQVNSVLLKQFRASLLASRSK